MTDSPLIDAFLFRFGIDDLIHGAKLYEASCSIYRKFDAPWDIAVGLHGQISSSPIEAWILAHVLT